MLWMGHVSPVGQMVVVVDVGGCDVEVDVDDGWQVSPVGQIVCSRELLLTVMLMWMLS